MKTFLAASPFWIRFLAVIAAVFCVLLLVVFFFPWNALREPINRFVSAELGRRFEITEKLSVEVGRQTTVRLDGVVLANPEWARDPYLLKAKAVEFDIKLWPLISGKVIMPRVILFEPQIGLQMEPDGRRTWALSRDTADADAAPVIGSLAVDNGSLNYRAVGQGADLSVAFDLQPEQTAGQGSPSSSTSPTSPTTATAATSSIELPLAYKAIGTWNNEKFTASGRAGGILQLSRDVTESFPLEVSAQSGKTTLKAKGTVENLQEFAGLNATFEIQGRNLEELYKLAGVVLPATPPYKLRGQLNKRATVWSASKIQGVLGNSDLSGQLGFDTASRIPMLTGKVQSKILDFGDLAPLIGLQVRPGRPAVLAGAAKKPASSNTPKGMDTQASAPAQAQAPVPAPLAGKVLPTAKLDLLRLKAMNADVIYSALDIRHVKQLPLDKGSVHVKLNNGVLQLDPLSLGVAGGTFAGRITIDINQTPAAFNTRFDVRAVQLNQLFPTIQTTKSSYGKISGRVDLKGRGNSMAQMLASSSGDVGLLMSKGEISNVLMELMGLDGGELIKFFLRGDKNVQLRCAAAAFDVKQGLMTSKVILLDTADTVIDGSGQINLANETLDILLKPQPKDKSILSLRSPLKITGTFGAPSAFPDKGALAGRAGLAIALGVINPLLGLLATIETGPGQDADCSASLAIASNSSNKTKAPASSPAPSPAQPARAAQ